MADLMNNAALHLCLGKDRMDGVREAVETINTGEENVLHASSLQVRNDAQPEVGAFATVAYPVAQHLSMAIQVDG